MRFEENCISCNSDGIKKIGKHDYYIRRNLSSNLLNTYDERVWIFFEKIINDKSKSKFIFDVYLCRNCGLIFQNPRLTDKEIKIKYHIINELGSVKSRISRIESSYSKVLEQRASRVYCLIKEFRLGVNHKLKIMDYGGQRGFNLIPFTKEFECSVVDYEKWKLPNGITHIGYTLNDLDKSNNFDVILLMHTLEHINYPVQFMKNLSCFLTYGGIIYIEVPLGCWREWQKNVDPITHFNFFSEESLIKCVENSGLNVIYVSTSYQNYGYSKGWCINLICKKSKCSETKIKKLSTKRQMAGIEYYLVYLFDIKKIFKYIKSKFFKNKKIQVN